MRDGVGQKKNKRGQRRFSALNHQATIQPGSRWGRNCLGCQHWGELGICQLYIPSPIQARRPRQSPTQTAFNPSLRPHSLLCTLGEQVAAYGDFPLVILTTVNQVEPLFISPASSAILSCAAVVVQLQHSQTRTLGSRSNAGVPVFFWVPVSRLESLSSVLWGLFSFKYLHHYRAFSCSCSGLPEPLGLCW